MNRVVFFSLLRPRDTGLSGNYSEDINWKLEKFLGNAGRTLYRL